MIGLLATAERRIGSGNLVFLIFLTGMLALWGVNSAWRHFSIKHLRDRAETAEAAAATAQANAANANAGAANATATRAALDWQLPPLRAATATRATAIESDYANPTPTDADLLPPDPRVLRELEAQEREARAAGDRLRRTRAK